MLEFRKNGVYADYMMNVFPTKTFTNHYSISTGYYADTHGILANSLYDNEKGSLSAKNNFYELFHYNPEIVPIWILNQQYGGLSGCIMWPGSNFEYANQTCHYLKVYNSSIPLKERVDLMINWLTEKNPPNLIMFYSEQPDKLAHMVGPDSKNVTDMIKELDLLTKYIQDKLNETNLLNRTNVIHLSDHGMESVTRSKFINLTEYIENGTYNIFGTSPVLQIVPSNNTDSKEIYEKLAKGAEKNGNFKVYTKDNILMRWHATNERRFGPIIVVANYGYAFQDMFGAAQYYEKNFNITFNENSTYGTHGYDNDYSLMHAYFMAKGPSFKENEKVEAFETVDLFSLFVKLLNIDALIERDGNFLRIVGVSNYKVKKGLNVLDLTIITVLCLLLIFIAIFYSVYQIKRRRNYNVSLF